MLKIIEADNFYEGNQSVEFQITGFEIPILKEHPELAIFNVKTFFVFIKSKNTKMAYNPVNDFLSKISLDKQLQIASALIMMNGLLREEVTTIDEVDATLEACGQILNDLDLEINLCDDIEAYVKTGIIPISDMSTAGSRPQDRADMTFIQSEAETITAITILSKLMSPVTGEFIHRHCGIINSQYKESWAAFIFTKLFYRKFSEIIKKINHYVNNLVGNKKSRDDAAIHYRGYTPDRTASTITAGILTKKFVSIDLFKNDGNVIKYLASCIKSYIESQQKSGGNQANIKLFANPKDGDAISGTEETNSSRVEIESTASHKPMVAPPVANFAAKWVINQTLTSENIDLELYEESCSFYRNNPMLITPITMFLLATYFGPDIGGGKSIYLLEAPITIKLAALLQIIAARQGAKHIAHMLTMKVSSEDRLSQATDFAFANSWRSSPEYTECRKKISSGFGEIGWDVRLRDIASTLTSKTFSYHTSPCVWKLINEPNMNNTIFIDPLSFMLELLTLVKTLWEERSKFDDSINPEYTFDKTSSRSVL